jgi:hypothetical protein
MDELCFALSQKIWQNGENAYNIFYIDELYDFLPEGSSRDKSTLISALQLLASGGYIDIKYARGDAYCIMPLKQYPAPTIPVPAEIKKKNNTILKYVVYLAIIYAVNLLAALTAGIILWAALYAE